MSSRTWITTSTLSFSKAVDKVTEKLLDADAILVGAGAGLSTAAGLTYSGSRFNESFADFRDAYGIRDMYSGGFYPFPDEETSWAWWSRMIWVNRYDCPVGRPYYDLLEILRGRDYFVLTTNVDHQFQRAGIATGRLFYTQGDYGLWQCRTPCHAKTYDNYEVVRQMVVRQRDMRVPGELIPRCPVCGGPMTMNLRIDDSFVQDEGWHVACARYDDFVQSHARDKVVYLELGVGSNTPGIIKYPFWKMATSDLGASYVQVNAGELLAPATLVRRAILVDGDASELLALIRDRIAPRVRDDEESPRDARPSGTRP